MSPSSNILTGGASPTFVTRWWRAIRPHSLGTAVAPVLLAGGVAVHDGPVRPLAFALALVGVALLLIGVNLGNDYFDFRSGADPPIGVGPRPLQAGLLSPRWFLIGSLAAFAIGGGIGVFLALSSPREILLLGLAGAALGFFYTAPPFRFGYRGLGEVVVFLLLGPGATLGAYLVTAGRFAPLPLLASIPIGLVVAALLHANNLRDLDDDARSGKRTLAVRLGPRWATREFAALIWAAEVAVAGLAVAVTPFAALGLLTLPWAWQLAGNAGPGLERGRKLMRGTASLHLRLAVLLAIGFSLSALGSRL
ncbi:MAG: 1,4-dihydroxy-2-naphthoate octaprenyltransferase [Chloroflexota bacterium]